MELIKTPNIKFMKYKYVALGITLAIVLAGFINIVFGRGLKLGVDFGEGTLVRVMFKTAHKVSDIRSHLSSVGLGDSVIQETGKGGREFQIRSIEKASTKTGESLESHEVLGNKVIDALRGNEGQAEEAKGLKDLNAIDLASLKVLLSTGFPGKSDEPAEKIIAYRNKNGIYSDFSDLSAAGVDANVISFLKEKTYLGNLTVMSRETVGPQVGKDLRKRATQAVLWSLAAMLVYIAFRFRVANGVSAIFTLLQDVLVTISIYSFTNREINLPIIAALLTIVGYSINDTIVIFDRVRENQKIMRKMPLENLMNVTINQMLGRTIITTGTVFLTVLALFLFGGKVINDFAFAMLIGSIEGVYSTIYLSCPVVLYWYKIFGSPKGARR